MKLKYFLLAIVLCGCTRAVVAQTARHSTTCRSHLELARTYQISDDPRTEQEFKLALSKGPRSCPAASLEYSEYLSRNLRFQEAATALQSYIKFARGDHTEDRKEVTKLLNAAQLKQRVENSDKPSLNDLIRLTRLVDAYGIRRTVDSKPYAEQALRLYPDSVDAMLLFANLVQPTQQDKDKVEQVLDKAATIDPGNAKVRSSRGWFYLFSRDRRTDAEREFRQALLLSGDKEVSAWKGLGYALMFNGKKAEAIAAFRNYLNRISRDADTEVPHLIEQLKDSSP